MITYTLCFLYILDMSLPQLLNATDVNLYTDEDPIAQRVYNGWPAKLGDVPYQISFKRRVRRYVYSSFCGGVIIGPKKLLSAAHCFVEKPGMCQKLCGSSGEISTNMLHHTYAVAGQLMNTGKYSGRDTPESGQWRSLKGVRYPPEYNFPKFDFAIVFLIAPFHYDSHVNEIPYASKFVDYNGKCLVSGYGRTSPKTRSDRLLLAHLTLIPWRECNRRHRRKMNFFVCTSSQFTDVGKGDSGGPLVCANTGDPREAGKGVLVGIVSGHRYGVGSFFTRVSTYYNYVQRDKSCIKRSIGLRLIILLFSVLQWKYFTILILFHFNFT